jgi:ankyrin repeat protein
MKSSPWFLCLLLLAGLSASPLSPCAISDASRASLELKRMNPEDYFQAGIQVEFVAAVGKDDVSATNRLLAQGANVNAVGKQGMTPLIWAMSKQSHSAFVFLLTNGANPNAITRWNETARGEQSASALQMAAILEDHGYLQVLLDHGGNPNQIASSSGQTPIFTAILHQRNANLELLLQKGAELDHPDQALKTPINYAVSVNRFALALVLLRHGADPTIKNRWGYSAIDTLRQFGNRGVEIGSVDDKAYPELLAELKKFGY